MTIDAFVKLYHLKGGYNLCDDGEFDEGFEKLALYKDADGDFSRVARQKRNGIWTSKLGMFEDTDHQTPEVLETGYGKVKQYLKRVVSH